MAKVGKKTLLNEKSDERIGGDCLNDDCVPSKVLFHIVIITQQAKDAAAFGFTTRCKPDVVKAMQYVKARQDIVKKHENVAFLRKKGMEVVLGTVY